MHTDTADPEPPLSTSAVVSPTTPLGSGDKGLLSASASAAAQPANTSGGLSILRRLRLPSSSAASPPAQPPPASTAGATGRPASGTVASLPQSTVAATGALSGLGLSGMGSGMSSGGGKTPISPPSSAGSKNQDGSRTSSGAPPASAASSGAAIVGGATASVPAAPGSQHTWTPNPPPTAGIHRASRDRPLSPPNNYSTGAPTSHVAGNLVSGTPIPSTAAQPDAVSPPASTSQRRSRTDNSTQLSNLTRILTSLVGNQANAANNPSPTTPTGATGPCPTALGPSGLSAQVGSKSPPNTSMSPTVRSPRVRRQGSLMSNAALQPSVFGAPVRLSQLDIAQNSAQASKSPPATRQPLLHNRPSISPSPMSPPEHRLGAATASLLPKALVTTVDSTVFTGGAPSVPYRPKLKTPQTISAPDSPTFMPSIANTPNQVSDVRTLALQQHALTPSPPGTSPSSTFPSRRLTSPAVSARIASSPNAVSPLDVVYARSSSQGSRQPQPAYLAPLVTSSSPIGSPVQGSLSPSSSVSTPSVSSPMQPSTSKNRRRSDDHIQQARMTLQQTANDAVRRSESFHRFLMSQQSGSKRAGSDIPGSIGSSSGSSIGSNYSGGSGSGPSSVGGGSRRESYHLASSVRSFSIANGSSANSSFHALPMSGTAGSSSGDSWIDRLNVSVVMEEPELVDGSQPWKPVDRIRHESTHVRRSGSGGSGGSWRSNSDDDGYSRDDDDDDDHEDVMDSFAVSLSGAMRDVTSPPAGRTRRAASILKSRFKRTKCVWSRAFFWLRIRRFLLALLGDIQLLLRISPEESALAVSAGCSSMPVSGPFVGVAPSIAEAEEQMIKERVYSMLSIPPGQRDPSTVAALEVLLSSSLSLRGFASFSFAERTKLCEVMVLEQQRASKLLLMEGHRCNSFYFIMSGRIEIFKGWDDLKYRLNFIGKGDTLGSVGLAMSNVRPTRSASVATVEPTDLLRIDLNDMRAIALSTKQQIEINTKRLEHIPLFDNDFIAKLLPFVQFETFEAQQVLALQDAPSLQVFWILSGTCRCIKRVPIAKPKVIQRRGTIAPVGIGGSGGSTASGGSGTQASTGSASLNANMPPPPQGQDHVQPHRFRATQSGSTATGRLTGLHVQL
ncbi:hypothetical protein BC831DRAFT_504726 [Entophlyctis helioformis]|nr:hypothetical protein BC831DRAFT_504726 [Entophlyctis helioformis]